MFGLSRFVFKKNEFLPMNNFCEELKRVYAPVKNTHLASLLKNVHFGYLSKQIHHYTYVSPMKWGDILFLAPLSVRPSVCPSVRPSVRPSVCPSHFRVRSISFEPLVRFENNFAQMSSMMRRCAVSMFDQGRFKVKVTI